MTEIERLFDEIHELESKYFLNNYTQNSYTFMREEVIKLLSKAATNEMGRPCKNPNLTEQSEGQMQKRVRRAFKFRSITNQGLPAKFVVQLLKKDGMGCVVIYKTLFSFNDKYFGVKRKWKDVWYCEERIVLKLETTLAIAREVFKFIDEHA